MHGEHIDSQRRGRLDGTCDRVGNVMKFKIQENALAALLELTYHVRATPREKWSAYLVVRNGIAEAVDQIQGRYDARNIKRDDNAIHVGFS
jgi:hypothetical protein